MLQKKINEKKSHFMGPGNIDFCHGKCHGKVMEFCSGKIV